MRIETHQALDNSFYITVNPHPKSATYFYSAVPLEIKKNQFRFFPTVKNYDAINSLCHLSLFKNLTSEERTALHDYNLRNYKASERVTNLSNNKPLVEVLEQIVEEVFDMDKKGIAFS